MEELKPLNKLEDMDERHILLGQVTARMLSKDKLHAAVSTIQVNDCVPDEIKNQFNVARNLALYSYYCYSFSPVVQSLTFTIIEFALKIKEGSDSELGLKRLLKQAIKEDWISDVGFGHLDHPSPTNEYCKSLVDLIPRMRNEFAHGSNQLTPYIIAHLSICADFVNQLFPGDHC